MEMPPKGAKITPATIPIKQPRIPALVPPNFWVLQTGMKLSKIEMMMMITAYVMSSHTGNSSVVCNPK